MKYVSIACFAIITVNLCSPASAATGNALAGGWNGTATMQIQRSAPAPAATSSAVSVFASSAFSFGSGGGSSANTGGAPSPEVNAALGLMLAGGTVAFLRRRRPRGTVLPA